MTKRNQVQLYDRVVVEDTVEADEKPARANKRTAARQKARYDSQHDDGSKTNANGKRGRPRVDPQEESAIEVGFNASQSTLFKQLTQALAPKDTD